MNITRGNSPSKPQSHSQSDGRPLTQMASLPVLIWPRLNGATEDWGFVFIPHTVTEAVWIQYQSLPTSEGHEGQTPKAVVSGMVEWKGSSRHEGGVLGGQRSERPSVWMSTRPPWWRSSNWNTPCSVPPYNSGVESSVPRTGPSLERPCPGPLSAPQLGAVFKEKDETFREQLDTVIPGVGDTYWGVQYTV